MNVLSWIAVAVQVALAGCLENTDKSHKCWPQAGYCITLFVNDPGVTWARAKQHCEDIGSSLLEIETPSIQLHAADQTAELGDVAGWIGGGRLTDNRLRTLDALHHLDIFASSIEQIGKEELNCVYAAMGDTGIRYVMENCDQKNGHHSVICKKDYSDLASNTMCLNGISPNHTCYVVMYNGRNNRESSELSPDWFSAQNMCRWDLPGFDLFDNTDVDVMTSVLEHVGGSIWTGYFRKPWFWSNGEITRYFNWDPRYRDSGAIGCMTIDKDGTWGLTECNQRRRYHLCLKTIPTSTPPSFTTTVATTVTTSDTPKTVDDQSSPDPAHHTTSLVEASKDNTRDIPTVASTTLGSDTQSAADDSGDGDKDLVPVYTGSAVGAVVFVVLVILVSVFVTRMRKRKSRDGRDGQRNVYVNTSADVTHEPTYENELVSNQNHQYNSLGNRPAALTNQDSQHTSLRNQPDAFVTNQDSQYSSLKNQTDHAGCAQDTAYEGICGTFDPALSQRVPDCGSPYAEVTIRK